MARVNGSQAVNPTDSLSQIKIPLLLIRWWREDCESNDAQVKFINNWRKPTRFANLKVIEGSRHEVLFEQVYKYRNQTLDAINQFFA